MIVATPMPRRKKPEENPATPGELRWKLRLARESHDPPIGSDTLGDKTGVSGPAIRAWENGTRQSISQHWVRRVAEHLQLPFEWFYDGQATDPPYAGIPAKLPNSSTKKLTGAVQLTRRNATPQLNLVPYWGPVPAGNWESPPEEPDWIQVSESVDPDGVVAVRVSGDSMLPRLTHGQLVCIKRASMPRDGVITLLRNQDNELTLKVPKYIEGKGWEFHSINPDYGQVTADAVEIIGYAVSIEETNFAGLRP